LRSLGVGLTQLDLENIMVPRLVSSDLGLLDASGATIAALLRDRFSLTASNSYPVTFDTIAAQAGQAPIAIGGTRWYIDPSGNVTGHWVAVRGFDGNQILLANPGGTGPNFGQQGLDRAAFAQRAPFAAVWIQVDATSGKKFRVGNTDGDGANMRSTPTTSATVLRSLTDGTEVSGGDHAWRAVTDSSGAQGWVASEYLVQNNGQFQVANTGGTGANLRPRPSTDGTPIKILTEGASVDGQQHAWRQVSDSTGATGWMADEFLVAEG
jgi:SH3-like domain-containing protein